MPYPVTFYVAAVVLAGMFLDLLNQRKAPWALPAFMIYVVAVAWYFADIVLYGKKYEGMPGFSLELGYGEVLIFLVAFRFMVPLFAQHIAKPSSVSVPLPVNADTLLFFTVIFWAGLLVCAVSQMGWDFMGALFPLDSRAGNLMWARSAAGDAGSMGFLISTGAYLYLVVCSFFGILAVLMRRVPLKVFAFGLIFLTWPSFLLSGTRNLFLAVVTPWAFCYLLFGRGRKIIRLTVLAAAVLFVNFAFLVIVSHRTNGLRDYLAGTEEKKEVDGPQAIGQEDEEEGGHEGLNMIQELAYINIFHSSGVLDLTWGEDYWCQVANVVPRAIWPNKPMMGIDYAKLRGFGGSSSDIGVFATVSTGMIGQGVLEYGWFFGSIAPAMLMALWCSLLARWWQQRASVLRLCLFLLGLGVTFSLGRDITSLTLWPVAFAYMFVRVLEKALPTKVEHSLARELGVTPIKPMRKPRPAIVPVGRVAGGLSSP